MGGVVGAVEGVLGEQRAALQVVGEERVVAAVQHPHGDFVGPDAAGGGVPLGERDVPLREALAALQVVGEELVLAAVGDPEDRAVGPHAAGRAVRLVQLELALLDPLARPQVVGVDGVVGAVAILEEPEGGAGGPGARGRVLGRVERLDVVLDRPLEVDAARRGAAAAAATAAAAAEATATTDDRTRRDRDGHIDARAAAVPVIGLDPDGVGVLRRDVEGDPGDDGDLTGEAADVEEARLGAEEAVRERVVLVDICRRHGRADVVTGLRALGHAASRGRRRERGPVVHPVDLDGDGGGTRERGAAGVPHPVGERVRSVVVGVGLVGDRSAIAPIRGFIHPRTSVERRGDHRQQQLVPVVLGVAVVGEHIDDDIVVLVYRSGVGDGVRRLVHVGDFDGDLDGVERIRAVAGCDGHVVRGRRFVIERIVGGDLDLAAITVNREEV